MKIVFITADVGNGNALKPVAKSARATGHDVTEFYGEGKVFLEGTLVEIEKALASTNWLITSLSSNEEKAGQEGLIMSIADKLGVKILIMSDIDGMMHRSRWCGGHASNARTITVVNEEEIEWARQYVGPLTRLICVKNPSWISYFDVTKSREEVCSRLGVSQDSKLIVVPGDKEVERMIARLARIVEASNTILAKLHIVVTIHPGADHSIDVFKRIVKYARHPVTFSVQKETGISTQDAIGVADLVITGNGTSTAYMGACLRKPTIAFVDPLVDALYWEDLSAQKSWSIADMGASALACNSQSLGVLMLSYLDPTSIKYKVMMQVQETAFTPETLTGASNQIVAELSI